MVIGSNKARALFTVGEGQIGRYSTADIYVDFIAQVGSEFVNEGSGFQGPNFGRNGLEKTTDAVVVSFTLIVNKSETCIARLCLEGLLFVHGLILSCSDRLSAYGDKKRHWVHCTLSRCTLIAPL